MGAELAVPNGVYLARELLPHAATQNTVTWSLDSIAGRLVEICGASSTAVVSTCTRLIHQAQKQYGLVTWIEATNASFYPPDFVVSGIDLSALPVIRSGSAFEACIDADAAIRSGAFALVVVNLAPNARLSFKTESRLSGLAKHHNTAVVLLTRRSQHAIASGSLVSLRAITSKSRVGHNRFVCSVEIVKDKRYPQRWEHVELRSGPAGLC